MCTITHNNSLNRGAGGPPLAVKKIDKPTFPLNYSLSQANVMMQDMPFTGKINIPVRLDKDGNPTMRSPTDVPREYEKNSLEDGTEKWISSSIG